MIVETVNHMQSFAIVISALALGISGTTAWLTLFRRGTIRMTRPAVIYLGPDGGTKNVRDAKVFLRSLVYCTAKTGRILESMFVSLQRNESKQNFNIWVHGDGSLARGSGLYVGEEGVLASHHFLAPRDANGFIFTAGTYRLEVFAKLVGTRHNLRLFSEELQIDALSAKGLATKRVGLYFDWGPDANRYIAHLEEGPPVAPTKHAPYENDWESPLGIERPRGDTRI